MSPEEFDNRLRSTFKDEYLPPKEQLWQNINSRLDEKPKNTAWFWAIPIAVILIVGSVWAGLNMNDVKSEESNVTEPNSVTKDAIVSNAPETNADRSENDQLITESQASDQDQNDDKTASVNQGLNSENNSGKSDQSDSKNTGSNSNDRYEDPSSSRLGSTGNTLNGGTISNPGISQTGNIATGNIDGIFNNNHKGKTSNNIQNDDRDDIVKRNLAMSIIGKFFHIYNIEPLEKVKDLRDEMDKFKVKKAEEMFYGGDFSDNRHWLNFGFGIQSSLNSFNDEFSDSTASKIHKDLMKNRKKLTGNGSGFQTHLYYQFKFGYKNRLSLETGLNYSSRSENIQINESTYDIAFRNSNNDVIINYVKLKLFIAYGIDTTWFDATQSFAMIAKNKYNVYTLPLKFQYEQPLNRNTFMALGIGGGASIIQNKISRHYDMVAEKEFDKQTQTSFSASLNTNLSIYTNYNGIGQFGVYGGYQMYLSPFNINNQYSIKMSDLQFGVVLRRPLDLK